MRHWYLYIILYTVVGVFGLSPFHGNDIATLSPVEVVWLEQMDDGIRLETEGGAVGIGETVSAALENMKQTAPLMIFLDTADFVIIKKGSEGLIAQLHEILRSSCAICVAETMPDLKEAAAYLRVHEPTVKMKNSDQKVNDLPMLLHQKGRMILVEQADTNFTADSMADRSG